MFVSLNLSRRDQTMPDSNEIHARVTKVLVEALGVEEDDIKTSSTLQGDLGAESIDFLDIVFRLEREFLIKIPRGELFSELVLQGVTEIVQDGHVTDEGLATLRSQMPYADLKALERDRRLNRIDDLFTVGLLSRYITWRLGGSGASDCDVNALSPRRAPEDLRKSVISTGIST
ncbi:MAG: acyl carrier protein [Isosphaeraceae bacterium]